MLIGYCKHFGFYSECDMKLADISEQRPWSDLCFKNKAISDCCIENRFWKEDRGKVVILIMHMRDCSGLNKGESSRGIKSTSRYILKIRCGI